MTNLANAPDRDPQVYLLPRDPTVHRSEVTITEKRAPTDESVRLLREMEAKAQAEVLKAVSITDNGFDCVIHQFRDHLSDLMRWRAVFKLNGKQMTADIETDPREDFGGGANLQAMMKLRDEMAKVIAAEVLHDGFVAFMRERWK